MKTEADQPRNGGSVSADNSENSTIQAEGVLANPSLDAASAEVIGPSASEGAAVGERAAPSSSEGLDGSEASEAAPSPSDASACMPVVREWAMEGDGDPYPPVTGSALEAEDRALLEAENERLRRLAS